jgi:hypothetical protein
VVVAVVPIVRVAVPAFAPVILTGLVAPKLKLGGSMAPAGLAVRAAVNVTGPVKPPAGVTVTVDVFPEDEPATKVGDVPVMEMPGGMGALIATVKASEAVLDAESVTLAVKLALPNVGAVPDNTPALDKPNPIAVRLLPPDVTVQV